MQPVCSLTSLIPSSPLRECSLPYNCTCSLPHVIYNSSLHSCTPIEGEATPLWLSVLSYLSLSITSLFVLEIPLTLWSLGLDAYNPFGPVPHAGLHLFDASVVLTTFVLEVVLRGKERELAGLLILLRLWRLVKLVGGKVPRNVNDHYLM
jgi:hypothetical protein